MSKEFDAEKDVPAKLLETAVPLFAAKGYAAVTIRELAEAAGVNSALVSYYFGGKEKLYDALLEQQMGQIRELIEELQAARLLPTVCLKKYAAEVLRVHQHCPYLFRLISGEMLNPTESMERIVKPGIAKAFAFLRATLLDGVRLGEFRKDLDVTYAVVSFAGILNFYFMMRPLARQIIPESGESDERHIKNAIRIFLQGVVKESE